MAVLANLPLQVSAHHGVSGQFDIDQTYDIAGVITRISIVNPHSYVYFDVADDAGTITNMRCEMPSGSLMKRRGWAEDMFEIGTKISITGSPDRADPTTCYMTEITFEDGTTATRQSTFEDGVEATTHAAPASLADGTPNIAGNWVSERVERGARGNGGRQTVALTPAGTAAVAGANPADNPRFNCAVTNIVMDWWFNQMVNEIEQTDSEITLTYGFMDLVRTIHLNGTDMPENFQPSRAGFSTGVWEGDTLVVTTTGFDEGWIMAPVGGDRSASPSARHGGQSQRADRPGGGPQPVKNSTELTVTENFMLNDDGTILTRTYTFTDPLYLETPMTGSDQVMRIAASHEPYACNDLTNERLQ